MGRGTVDRSRANNEYFWQQATDQCQYERFIHQRRITVKENQTGKMQEVGKIGAPRSWLGFAGVVALALASSAAITPANAAEDAAASDSGLTLRGYLRTYAGWNASNTPETAKDDSGKLSMLRGSALVDASGGSGPVSFRVVGRVDREQKTSYLENLENLTHAQGGRSSLMNLYNAGELREWYVDIAATERLNLRVGKQQVVWGESDFFHAMDIVNGFNQLWAPPTEESDETRKGLVMFNAKLLIPEANGALQILVRPGVDRNKDIGNTPDVFGGRNAAFGYRGFDAKAIVNIDYRHPDGDVKDTTGGFRWTGSAAGLNYSLAYLKTFTPNFVINSNFNPYMKTPTNPIVGDLIYPKMEVYGASVNGYSATVDAVLSAEVALQKDVAYNQGTGAIGLLGIKKKNQVRSMFRMDKNVDFSWLGGAIRPSLWSVQIFDTWITNFRKADDLVLIPTFNHPAKKHETIITNIFALSYANSNINPVLVAAYDVTNGGGFVVPYVDFSFGTNWRLRVEYDYFYYKHQTFPADPNRDDSPTTFGLAAHNNQFWIRGTYQF